MTVADKLLAVNQVKQDIKSAIVDKGVDLTGVDFSGYAGKIDELPTQKEEQTKTVSSPNFASGNVVVTPDAGKVLTQVTVVKDNDLVPENIVKDVNIFGVVGTAETGGGGTTGGYTLTIEFVGGMTLSNLLVEQANGSEFEFSTYNNCIIKGVTYIKTNYELPWDTDVIGTTEAELNAGKTLTNDVKIVMND